MEELPLLLGRSADGRRWRPVSLPRATIPHPPQKFAFFWAWRWSAGVGKDQTSGKFCALPHNLPETRELARISTIPPVVRYTTRVACSTLDLSWAKHRATACNVHPGCWPTRTMPLTFAALLSSRRWQCSMTRH